MDIKSLAYAVIIAVLAQCCAKLECERAHFSMQGRPDDAKLLGTGSGVFCWLLLIAFAVFLFR